MLTVKVQTKCFLFITVYPKSRTLLNTELVLKYLLNKL